MHSNRSFHEQKRVLYFFCWNDDKEPYFLLVAFPEKGKPVIINRNTRQRIGLFIMYNKQKFIDDLHGQKKFIVQLMWGKKEMGYEGLIQYLVAERLTRCKYGYRSISKSHVKWLTKIGFLIRTKDTVKLNPSFIPKNQE